METQAKMEKDWSQAASKAIQASHGLPLSAAIEQLLVVEKQSRTSADLASNSLVLLHIVDLCFNSADYKALNEQVVALAKKRALLKQVSYPLLLFLSNSPSSFVCHLT